jgi:hypothetical protein
MSNDPKQLKKNFSDERCRKAGVGVPTGVVNDLVDIETDTVKGHGNLKCDGSVALQALEAELGPLPSTREGESPSASVHRLFKHPGPGFHVKSVDALLGLDSSVARALKTQNQNVRDRNPIVYFQDPSVPFLDVQNAPPQSVSH